jgi:DNA-binding NtrC family response regulator
VLALPAGPLRDRLEGLLGSRGIDLRTDAPHHDVAAHLGDFDADLVFVRSQDLSTADRRRILALADQQHAPDVVVVGSGLDEAARVDLVACGATDAIDSAQLDRRAADALQVLAAGAGQHGAPATAGARAPVLSDFASRSKSMHAFLDLVRRVAPTDAVLLLTGETGVGKEHLARAVHASSPRAAGPFVTVNCGALPEHLLESELFGHAAGAFTGARGARQGCFRHADGGTLLLDEIGEVPTHLQVKLLTVLQRGEIRPIGSDADVRTDVRVMAATNRDLREDVEQGRFREDLYYRLNVVELRLPPLRERPEDLPTLIGALLRQVRTRVGRDDIQGLHADTLTALLHHDWPGNVRELINVIERAVLVSTGPLLRPEDLPPEVRGGPGLARRDEGFPGRLPPSMLERPWRSVRGDILRRVERHYLEGLLESCGGAVGRTAQRAGISARSLYEKMKAHGLRKEDYR